MYSEAVWTNAFVEIDHMTIDMFHKTEMSQNIHGPSAFSSKEAPSSN